MEAVPLLYAEGIASFFIFDRLQTHMIKWVHGSGPTACAEGIASFLCLN